MTTTLYPASPVQYRPVRVAGNMLMCTKKSESGNMMSFMLSAYSSSNGIRHRGLFRDDDHDDDICQNFYLSRIAAVCCIFVVIESNECVQCVLKNVLLSQCVNLLL